MFPEEYLWLVVTIPAIIVASLIFIKLAQLRLNKQTIGSLGRGKIQIRKTPNPPVVTRKGLSAPISNVAHAEAKRDEQEKPENCQKYLGYLYMRQGSERMNIPTDCYDCPRLLQCMYSPNVIERVYGQ